MADATDTAPSLLDVLTLNPARDVEGRALLESAADPGVQALVDQVDSANLSAKVSALAAIHTRRADQPGAWTARDMIKGWLDSTGLATRLENFSSSYSENVIAEIPGTVHPDEIVVVGAEGLSGLVVRPKPR